jgi:hypothetical protein
MINERKENNMPKGSYRTQGLTKRKINNKGALGFFNPTVVPDSETVYDRAKALAPAARFLSRKAAPGAALYTAGKHMAKGLTKAMNDQQAALKIVNRYKKKKRK